MKRITPQNETPERLDKVLTEALDATRSQIQKAIKSGAILVDGNEVPVKFPVTKENTVDVNLSVFEKSSTEHPAPKLDTLYEDDDVIVVNKPAGLLVHETEVSDEPTLVDGLVAYDPKIKNVGEKPERSGIVHRLDKHASGVLITAKNQEAFDHLKAQFKQRNTVKKYTVLVHGEMEEQVATINFPISRSKTSGRMAAKPASQGGKEAITHYEVIKQFSHHALLDVEIETGRTHQIRAHFFSKGHPVVGDTLYIQRSQKLLNIGRLFLHARELTITLPNGEEKTFIAPLPKELELVLEDIPKI